MEIAGLAPSFAFTKRGKRRPNYDLLAGNGRRTRRKSNTPSEDGSSRGSNLDNASVATLASIGSDISDIGQRDDESVKSTSTIASSKFGARPTKRKPLSGRRRGSGPKRVTSRVNTPFLAEQQIGVVTDELIPIESGVEHDDSATVAQEGMELMSVSQIRAKEKELSTMKKYVGHWRRFHLWLERGNHIDWLVEGMDPSVISELFLSIQVPLSQEIFDSYLGEMMYHGNGKLKHHSTLEGFGRR